ncbi:MAG TPA: hypothetical protein VMB71_14755, partial [Acetobacteraceae bacterium]|nr:hypothetical protein [Acetobacteraceae bacterium]
MREMTVKILAGLAIPAAIIAVLLPAPGGGTAPSGKQNVPLLPGLHGHAGDLATITITGADGKITLTRTPTAKKPAEGWLLRDKGFYPVPVATIRPVLDGLIALHGVAPKTASPKLYARLDVGNPGKDLQSHLVSLFDTKAATLGEVILGRQKEATGVGATPGTYARLPGEKQSWLAEPAITLPAETLDWVDQSIVDIDADQVKQVVLNIPGSAPLDFARDKPADKLAIQGLPASTKLKSDTPGTDVENVFASFNMQDVEPATKLKG